MEEDLISLAVAADLLGVNHSTIWRRVRAKELPATKVGKTYVVSRTDVERLRDSLLGVQGHPRPSTPPLQRKKRSLEYRLSEPRLLRVAERRADYQP